MKRKMLLILLILLLCVTLGGCLLRSGGSQSSQPKEENVKEAEKTSSEPQTYKVGVPIALKDGGTFTVVGVEASQGSGLMSPKEGMEFVIVTVAITNGGSKEISYNEMFDFKCKNSQGQITRATLFSGEGQNTSLSSGSLASGGNVSGTVVFEEPIGDPGLVLIYESLFSLNKSIEVPLG